MSAPTPEDFHKLLTELDAGVFEHKVIAALAEVALATAITGNKGAVHVIFEMERIGESSQIELVHKIKSVRPKERGKVTEEDATSTPMHVLPYGRLSTIATTGDLFKPAPSKE